MILNVLCVLYTFNYRTESTKGLWGRKLLSTTHLTICAQTSLLTYLPTYLPCAAGPHQ